MEEEKQILEALKKPAPTGHEETAAFLATLSQKGKKICEPEPKEETASVKVAGATTATGCIICPHCTGWIAIGVKKINSHVMKEK